MKGNLNTLLSAINGVVIAGVALKAVLIFQSGRNADKSLTEILVRVKRVVYAAIIVLSISSFSGWAQSKLQVLASVNDVGGIGNVIAEFMRIARDTVVLVTGSLTIFHFVAELVQYQFGAEEEKPQHMMNAKKQMVIGIGIICGAGVITAILSYF